MENIKRIIMDFENTYKECGCRITDYKKENVNLKDFQEIMEFNSRIKMMELNLSDIKLVIDILKKYQTG